MNKKKIKRAQSEIVGFVLIVVVVIVAAMIFLIISLKTSSDSIKDSRNTENLISSIMDYTTKCAVVYEPNYDNIEDLIASCAENSVCSNLNISACSYLSETLKELMKSLIKTESQINFYKVEILERDKNIETEIIEKISHGNCTGSVSKAQKLIPSSTNYDIIFRIILCKSDI